jgi:hypothetical protein
VAVGFLSIGNGACVLIMRATAFVYARLRAVSIPACRAKTTPYTQTIGQGVGFLSLLKKQVLPGR